MANCPKDGKTLPPRVRLYAEISWIPRDFHPASPFMFGVNEYGETLCGNDARLLNQCANVDQLATLLCKRYENYHSSGIGYKAEISNRQHETGLYIEY
jgi:hypothetical protein